jgi:flagellar protein FlgJ
LAINPPSDIVLDVARAADPLRLQEAALRLTGAVDDEGGNGFSTLVDGFDPWSGSPAAISAPGLIGLQSDFGAKGAQVDRSAALSGPAMKPYVEFEAFVLQTFIQSMLPTDADGVFGQGTAGEMWKGLLAEQLGKQLAKAGGIGIAAQVLKAHPGAATSAAGADPARGSPLGSPAAPISAAPSSWLPAMPPPTAERRQAELAPLDISPLADRGMATSRTP